MAQADYPSPILVVNTTGVGLQPNILDARNFILSRIPPVIQVVITNAATVTIWGSGKISTTDPPTLIDPVASPTTVTASDFIDLIAGCGIFYQFAIAGNTGRVTIYALPGATNDYTVALPQLVRMTTNATAGL